MGHGIVDLDRGFYQEARNKNVHAGTYLTQLVNPEPPEIEAVAQRCLKRFRQEDDGSVRAQAVRQYAYDVSGLEKELKARGIRTRGPSSDRVEKFFISANDTPLFPAFLASQVIAGILLQSLVPRLAAGEERIDSHVAEKVTLSDTTAQRQLRFIGEGADLPKTKIVRAEGNITLYLYGRLLESSYDAIKLMHLNIFGLFLSRIGRQIGVDETDDLIETLIAGDGTAGSALVDTDVEVTGVLDYDELCRLRLALPVGYDMTDAIINDANLRTVLNMAEFKDPLAGFQFQRTGEFMDALGAQWHRWTSTGSTSFSTDRVLGLDNRLACFIYREGDMLEESDRLIDKRIQQTAVSEWMGAMKLDNNASQCLDIN